MLKNYLKIIFRNTLKYKLYTFINIVGLSTGIASFVLLLLYVNHEYSYDQFHEKADHIYRVNITDISEVGIEKHGVITAAVAPDMASEFPEIEDFVRFSFPSAGFFMVDGNLFEEQNITYADSTVFSVFSFNLLKGNPSKALVASNSIVLTQSLARKMFGDQDPLGRSIILNHEDNLTVTGIVEDVPANSHLQFSALISFSSLLNKKVYLDWNGGWNYLSYVLLNEEVDSPQLEKKFQNLLDRKINILLPDVVRYEASLEKLTDIHLYTDILYPLPTKGNLTNLWVFLSIAIIILALACMNFINLSTSQVARRVKEIGIRKVVGADRMRLVWQFLLESILLSTFSFLIALELVSTFQESFALLMGTRFDIWHLSYFQITGLGFVIVLLVGLISGSYPALYISAFKPVRILKGQFSGGRTSGLNKVLITFQFVISLTLIVCTLVIFNQISFIKNKELGYGKDNIITVPLSSAEAKNKFQLLKTAFDKVPGVSGTGSSSQIPGSGFTSNGYFPEGTDVPLMFNALDIDPDYLETMSIDIIQGRSFEPGVASDSNAYLINEALAEKMGWSNPIGKTIERNGKHEVIGTVEDFHFATLHEPINPLIITLRPFNGYDYMSVKVHGRDMTQTLERLESEWRNLLPEEVFVYKFLDKTIESVYAREEAFKILFVFFSSLAILIACLGIFGLISYSVQRRSKEVGIRKVLGADILNILFLLSKEFMTLLLLACIFSWPFAYFGIDIWLQEFSYRISFPYSSLLYGTFMLLILTSLTVFGRSLKTATSNPVDYIKND